jgi:hypothetical protein
MPRGVYVRSAQARANMSAAAKARAGAHGAKLSPAPAGYGRKGKKFLSVKAYKQSAEGKRHAADPNLKAAPVRGPGGKVIRGKKGNVFFNPAKAKAAQASARAGSKTGSPRKGAGSGQIPRPGTTKTRMPNPGAGRPRKGGGTGTVARRRK